MTLTVGCADRVHKGRGRVADEEHITALDGLEAADGGAVEAEAGLEQVVLVVIVDRNREMLPLAVKVGEFDVDKLNIAFFDGLGYFRSRATV